MTRKSQKTAAAVQPEPASESILPETPKVHAPQDRKLLQEARAALTARSVPSGADTDASPAETRNVNALLGLLLAGSEHPSLEELGLSLLERLSNIAVISDLAMDTAEAHDHLTVTVGSGAATRWNLDPEHAGLGQDDLRRLGRGLHVAARCGLTISRGPSKDPLTLEDQRLGRLARQLSGAPAGLIETLARTRPATHPLNSGRSSKEAAELPVAVAV